MAECSLLVRLVYILAELMPAYTINYDWGGKLNTVSLLFSVPSSTVLQRNGLKLGLS